MGEIHVHEFMTLDGVVDEPTWSLPYPFLPEMEATIGAICDRSSAILLGRVTYEMFAPAWSTRTVEDDPGAPFFNETPKHVVSATLTEGRGARTARAQALAHRYDWSVVGPEVVGVYAEVLAGRAAEGAS